MSSGHIEADDLESYSKSALPEDKASLVEQHLLICEPCRERLGKAEEYISAMQEAARRLRSQDGVRKPPAWSFPRLIPALAALILIGIAIAALPLIRRGAPAPFAVSLQTMRGQSGQTIAPTGRPLVLVLDLTGLATSPSYRIEMVNGSGDPVWQGAFSGSGAASVTVPAQNQGIYFVRVALPSGEMLREYELEVRESP